MTIIGFSVQVVDLPDREYDGEVSGKYVHLVYRDQIVTILTDIPLGNVCRKVYIIVKDGHATIYDIK